MSDRREQIAKLVADAEREAYARGYRDAIAALLEAAQAKSSSLDQGPMLNLEPKATNGAKSEHRPRGRPERASSLILAVIRERPGIKGVEIPKALQSRGTPVQERTVRSALRRLRLKHEIRKYRGGGWHAASKPELPENEQGEAPGTPPH